ncbi:MAG TPA: prepilin-type N-terminal cleavage/methylation domain-containing protein, partial [Patescibacteria group bacterium]|nr:prepilin-type N-terminal cleavage/methylation domain-containing protein [Patescibacteria group bacterium]
MTRNKGFTLIELLVVIAIIGILASIIIVSLIGVRERARDARRKSDLRSMRTALELYYGKNKKYPQADNWVLSNDQSGWQSALGALTQGPLPAITDLPEDPLNASEPGGFPWGESDNYIYAYMAPGANPTKYDLVARLE